MFSWLKGVITPAVAYPPGPEGLTLYAIGDIHGRSDCLETVHALVDRDVAARKSRDPSVEIYIGDYVDRGPDSRGVLDRLLARSETVTSVFLRGNHELIMDSFLRGQTPFEEWRASGGLETILSYGVDARALLSSIGTIRPSDLAEKIPNAHLRFLSRLENFRVFGRYCFVHAGVRPGISLDRQSIEDLAWIRDDFLNFVGDTGYVVIHGHTAVKSIDFLPTRVNIDTGAYVTNCLSVIRIDSGGVSTLTGSSI